MILNDRYRVIQAVGSGSFGQTFLVEDSHMPSKRLCILKQLKPIKNAPQYYQAVQERFQREATILETLGESNEQIPSLYAYFEESGQFYLVQEWIEGQTLAQKLQTERRLSESSVKEILASVLAILDYVHANQIIHRDIKLDNIMLRQRDSKPVLIDFGAVKEAMGTLIEAQDHTSRSIVIGTLGYMPPEQAAGRPVYASDLYSLGMTAIRLLTGKSFQELETDSRTGEIKWRPHALNVSDNFAAVLDKAIQSYQGNRYATAQEMLEAIQATTAPTVSSVSTPQRFLNHSPSCKTKLQPSTEAQAPKFDVSLKGWLSNSYPEAVPHILPFVSLLHRTQLHFGLSNSSQKLLIGSVILILGFVGFIKVRDMGTSPKQVVVLSPTEKTSPEPNKELVLNPTGIVPSEITAKNFLMRGADKSQNGDYTGAVEDFNQALRLDPNADTYNNRGLVRYRLGDKPGAMADFNQALRLDPNSADTYNNRGSIRAEQSDIKGAMADFNQALRIDPNLANVYNNRGFVRRRLGDTEGAIKDFNQALVLKDNYTEAYKNRGLARTDLGDAQGAIEDFNKAVWSNPDSADAYKNRALARSNLGDAQGAIEDFNQALRLDPNSADAYENRGVAYAKQGNKQEVLKDYQKAAELYIKQGELERYKRVLEKLKKLHPQPNTQKRESSGRN
jgi:serine/threonine-protein kinase